MKIFPDVAINYVPRAWFLNLERLFENAVRNIFAENLINKYYVSNGVKYGMRIFSGVKDCYTVNPDIIASNASKVAAVGDIKYKIWKERPKNSDVYQLLVHAAALNCDRAFLVFPIRQI